MLVCFDVWDWLIMLFDCLLVFALQFVGVVPWGGWALMLGV